MSGTSQKATSRHELFLFYLTTFSSPLHPLPSPSPPSSPFPPSSSQCAREGARCDYSLFVGASNSNATSLPHLSSQALALKMYLNTTFSTLKLDSMETWMKVHVTSWTWAAAFCVQFFHLPHTLKLFLLTFSTLSTGPRIVPSVCTLKRSQQRL